MQKWKKCTRLIHVLRYRSVSFVNIFTLCYLADIGTAHTEKTLSKLLSQGLVPLNYLSVLCLWGGIGRFISNSTVIKFGNTEFSLRYSRLVSRERSYFDRAKRSSVYQSIYWAITQFTPNVLTDSHTVRLRMYLIHSPNIARSVGKFLNSLPLLQDGICLLKNGDSSKFNVVNFVQSSWLIQWKCKLLKWKYY